MKLSACVWACLFATPTNIPYAEIVNMENLPRSDSEFSLGDAIIQSLEEKNAELKQENERLRQVIRRMASQYNRLENSVLDIQCD